MSLKRLYYIYTVLYVVYIGKGSKKMKRVGGGGGGTTKVAKI